MRVKDLYRAVAVTVDAGQSLASAERDLARAVADDADMAVTPVGYYVSLAPASAAPDEDAEAVAGRMLELGVRHLPVVDHGEVIGMLSVRDLLVLAAWQPAPS
jgi:CBS domain-containing protein